MINFKREVADRIAQVANLSVEEIEHYIEIPKDTQMGDYAFPCFCLAKILKKAPPVIAQEIKQEIKVDETIIEKVEIVGAYLNFYIQKGLLAKEVLEEIESKKEKYGSTNEGEGKNIIVEYSAPNIAKPFHIGHLRSTVIGAALYKIYQFLGYHTTGINHLGDYGTQFGKMIEGYKRWGNEYDIENNPIDELTKIYVRINNLCKEDEQILEICRDNFKKLEDGEPYCKEVWEKLRTLSLKEFQRIYDLLEVKFDSLKGEAFYSDKMPEISALLEKSGRLVKSEGAKIIDLEEKKMAPLIVEKSNGSSTYATRDLAAILYRARTYDFDKCLYVVAYEQNLHFAQVFEVAKLLGLEQKYLDGLIHVPFGMVRLKEGKMSTREGKVIKLEELLKEAIRRVREIIEEKNPSLNEQEKEEIARKVGIGAVIFNDLANSRIKDEVFDWETILNFNGETGPYIQYTYVRTNSVLNKVGALPKVEEIQIEKLLDKEAIQIIKLLYNYTHTIEMAAEKNEPSIISRYLIELAKAFSSFYNENKIITEDKQTQDARVYLTYATNLVLKSGANLLGINMPEKM